MMMNAMSQGRRNGWRIAGWSMAAGLMLLPLVAMRFSDGMKWTGMDFVFAGVMIGGTGLVLELLVRRSGNFFYRAGAVIALGIAFLTIWASGAVGIIGDEGNPANLMFGGVLAVALVGALAARFRAAGMALAMLAAAATQLAVGAVAIIAGLGVGAPAWPFDVIGATGVFTAAWLISGTLFRRAARRQA